MIVGVLVGVLVTQEPNMVKLTMFDVTGADRLEEVIENWLEKGPGQATWPHQVMGAAWASRVPGELQLKLGDPVVGGTLELI